MRKFIVFSLSVLLIGIAPGPGSEVQAQGKSRTKKPAGKGVKKARRARGKRKSNRRRRSRKDRWPPMHLEQMHTREQIKVRLFDRRGRTVKGTMRKLQRFMRCHRTGKTRSISWRLIRNLYRVSRHYPGKKILVYSAYRHRRVARLKTSRHIRGQAVDFAVQGIRPHALRDYLRRSFKKAGVGYYPQLPFVHFDVRRRAGFWVDVSGSGEDSSYVSNSYQYIKNEGRYGVGSVFLLAAEGLKRGDPSYTQGLASLVPEGLAHGGPGDPPPANWRATQPRIMGNAAVENARGPGTITPPPAPQKGDMPDNIPARKATKALGRPVQGPPPVGTDVTPGKASPGSSSVGQRGEKVASTDHHPPIKAARGGSKNTEGNRLAR